MAFEEALDIGSLPKTLQDDFKKIEKLEGRYLVTNIIQELDWTGLYWSWDSAKTKSDPLCLHPGIKLLDHDEILRQLDLYRLELVVTKEDKGTTLYKEGFRWTSYTDSSCGQSKVDHLVIDC